MTRTPNVECSVCGAMRWRKASDGTTSPLVCMPCRRTGAGVPHGLTRYKQYGCRCDECKEVIAAAGRAYRASFHEREGVSLSSKRATTTRYYWIAPTKRREIYERDGWICQLCFDPVDRNLEPTHRFAASLDHIECRAWVLIPDHSPANLRLAHRACNSRRRDRVDA